MKNEPIKTEYLSMAQATRSCGGKVFVQVLQESENILSPNEIDLSSHLVDGYVLADRIDKDHRQTNKYSFRGINKPWRLSRWPVLIMTLFTKIIAKKVLDYLDPASNVILGQGLTEV